MKAALVALALPIAAAAAEPSPSLATGPIAAVPALGHVGRVRRAEPRSEVGLAVQPGIIYDEPGFYGMVDMGLEAQGSWRVAEETASRGEKPGKYSVEDLMGRVNEFRTL